MHGDLTADFLRDGFVKLPGAVEPDTARACAQGVWELLEVDPRDPTTYPGPVAHAAPTGEAYRAAANSPALLAAIDELAGPGHWGERPNVGLCVARFPSPEDPGGLGWHIESSYHPDGLPWPGDGQPWRTNVFTRARALLLLLLFTEIGEDDAPTRIRVGSHQDVPAALHPAGAAGLDGNEASPLVEAASAHRPVALATGVPGDVYVCHPFLVHAAQLHRGTRPRLIAQPPIELVQPYTLTRAASECPPVERAVRTALDEHGLSI